jgi:hypothetical protein
MVRRDASGFSCSEQMGHAVEKDVILRVVLTKAPRFGRKIAGLVDVVDVIASIGAAACWRCALSLWKPVCLLF